MEQNTVQLESMIKMLMAGIAARGLRPESQENYTRICNSIRKYQRTKAANMDIESLLDNFMKDFENGGLSGKGKPCLGYLRFNT